MKVYAFIVRLPLFINGLLFYTWWQWCVIIYFTLLWALLWTAWGIVMIVATIDVRFFNTTDTPWHTIGEEISDYGETVKSMHDWLTEYTSSNRERLILWIVVILIGLGIISIVGINKYNDFRTGQATINDFCQQIGSHNLQAAYSDLSPRLQGMEDQLYGTNPGLEWAYRFSNVGSVNDLHQATIEIDTSGSCGGGTFLVDATLVQDTGGGWKIDQLSSETPNPCIHNP